MIIEKYPSDEFSRLTMQKNLKQIRQILNWTSLDLGKRIGVTKQTISNLETGNSNLTKLHYIAIRTVVDFEIENIESTEPDRAERARLLVQLLFDPDQFKDIKHYDVDEQFDKIHEASRLIASSISISTALAVVGALLGIASTKKWLK